MIFFIYFYISYFVFLYNICFVACDMFDESFKIPIWLKLGYVLWFLLYTETNVHRCSSIGVFLWNLPNFKEFGKFHRKAPVLESPFNKLQVFRPATLLKRDSNTGVFLWTFYEHIFLHILAASLYRGVFKTRPSIYDGMFFAKIVTLTTSTRYFFRKSFMV